MPILTARERINTEIGGRYRAKRIIGEGAFGAVFAAEHMLTAREVALKILHPHLVQTEQIAQRFLLEAQTMAKIRHPGICQILDAGREPDGTIFLALELLEGETLEESLERRGKLPRAEALRIAIEVLDALAAAHAREIVHRDIKPANIYLNRESEGVYHAKLLDFGIAHVAPKGGNKLTDAGVVLGTPEYMPPEQARGKSVGPVSDVWAVGVVLYEMLSGMVPWSGDSAASVLIAVANNPLTDIRELQPDTPVQLVQVINRALEKDPERRFHSAEEMRDAITAAAESEGLAIALPGSRPSFVAGSGEWKAVRVPGSPVGPAAAARAPASSTRRSGGNIEFDLPESTDTPSLMIALDQLQPHGTPADLSADLPVPPPPETDSQRSQVNSGEHPAADAPRIPFVRPPPATPAGSSGEHRAHKSIASAAMPTASSNVDTTAQRTQSTGRLSAVNPAKAEPVHVSNTGPTFQTIQPKKSATPLVLAGVIGLSALAAAAYYVASHPAGATGQNHADASAGHDDDAGEPEEDAQTAAARARLRSIGAVPLPFALRGEDARVFVRHLTAGPPRANRMVGTCAAGSIRLFNTQNGLPVTETTASIACDNYDLSLIGDLDNDGNDDVAAVNANKSAVLVLSTQDSPARALQTVALPGAFGLAAGTIEANGRSLVVAVAAPRVGDASELVAIDVRTGAIAWRTRGRAGVTRLGHPTDLGLAIGPDADGDGVRDVVAGASPPSSVTPDRLPELPRCVELISGASGRLLWPLPFCQRRGNVQSVALGPDIDGDGKGDVAVSTDVSRGSEPRVVLLSGASATLIRRIPTPEGPAAQGFGWPVAFGPDSNGDGVPDLAVGSVSSSATHATLLSSRDGQVLATMQVQGSDGFPNMRLMLDSRLWRDAAVVLMIGSPEEGLKVFSVASDVQ
jgi:serine/threonine-protein kinase